LAGGCGAGVGHVDDDRGGVMKALRRWISARAPRADDGLSLAEMIVTLGLTTLVAGFTFALLMQGVRSTGSSAVRQDNAGQARVAIEAVSRNLRTAVSPIQFQGLTCTSGCTATTAVTAADGSSLTFYANINGVEAAPSRITYALTGSSLVETVQAPVVSATNYSFCAPGGSCAVRTRTLARGVVTPTAAEPLFTYYGDGAPPPPLGTPPTAAELVHIDAVEILLKVRSSAKWGTPATTVAMRVALPNADYARATNGGS
jgi:Tfp pilus assembly protein FimT